MIERRRARRAGVKVAMLAAVAAIALSGCSDLKSNGVDPIDWYRDLSGASANDAKDRAPNSKNLAEGSNEPYPNLASVPKVPDNAITKADREKMAQSLVADRQNAQYTDEKLHAGQNMTAVPPPMPQPKPTPEVKVTVPAATPKVGAAKPAPAPATAAAPIKQETLPSAAPAPKVAAAAPAAPKAQPAAPPPAEKKKADEATKKKQAKVKRGAEKPPEESSLQSPTPRAMPEGEAARTPPPAPRSEEVAAAEPSRSDADTAKPHGNVTVKAVEIGFSPGPFRARILPADRHALVEIAKTVAHNKGRVRIVGYGGAPPRGDREQREFQSFNAALDNAKAVGVELAKLGVPASRIDLETKANVNSADKAEVFVEY